jgi:citrate lyase gamma subunit
MTTDRQTPGMEYTIELQNIEDTEENIIENLYATFFGTASEKVESDFFRIQKIEPINERSVKLYFTHPVNLNAENSIYYTIKKDGYPFMYGEKDQLLARTINSEKYCVMLTLKSGTFTKGTRYSVEISGDMTSAYGVDMNDGYGDAMLFVAVDGQSQSFKLMDIAPYDNETIRLTFNKEVNMFLAQQIYNFYLTDQKNQPIPIKKVTVETQGDENGKVLYISMGETIKKDDKYYLTINNLNDATKQEYITEITYSFIAEYETTDRLSMIRITPIDVQTIDVYFSDMLDMETAVRSDYYNVTLRNGNASVYPQIVLYDRDIHPYKVTLFFNRGDLTERREYELRVSYELQDYLGTPAGETLKSRFNASPKQKENPSIEAVTPISSDAVLLSFTRELAFSQTNLSPENYTVEYNINGVNYRKAPLSVIYINSRTLVLKFDKLEYDIPYTLKFATLVDYSGDSFKVTGQGTNYVEFKLKEK